MLCHLSLGRVNGVIYSSWSVCSPLCLRALGAALGPLFALTCSCPSLLGALGLVHHSWAGPWPWGHGCHCCMTHLASPFLPFISQLSVCNTPLEDKSWDLTMPI